MGVIDVWKAIENALIKVKSYADSKSASTLSSAKTYADTKKTEAINSASSDATTKANGALASAKTYTDNALSNFSGSGTFDTVGGTFQLDIDDSVYDNIDISKFSRVDGQGAYFDIQELYNYLLTINEYDDYYDNMLPTIDTSSKYALEVTIQNLYIDTNYVSTIPVNAKARLVVNYQTFTDDVTNDYYYGDYVPISTTPTTITFVLNNFNAEELNKVLTDNSNRINVCLQITCDNDGEVDNTYLRSSTKLTAKIRETQKIVATGQFLNAKNYIDEKDTKLEINVNNNVDKKIGQIYGDKTYSIGIEDNYIFSNSSFSNSMFGSDWYNYMYAYNKGIIKTIAHPTSQSTVSIANIVTSDKSLQLFNVYGTNRLCIAYKVDPSHSSIYGKTIDSIKPTNSYFQFGLYSYDKSTGDITRKPFSSIKMFISDGYYDPSSSWNTEIGSTSFTQSEATTYSSYHYKYNDVSAFSDLENDEDFKYFKNSGDTPQFIVEITFPSNLDNELIGFEMNYGIKMNFSGKFLSDNIIEQMNMPHPKLNNRLSKYTRIYSWIFLEDCSITTSLGIVRNDLPSEIIPTSATDSSMVLIDVKILSEGGYLKQFTITFVEEVKQYTTISNTLNAYVTYREVF